MRIAVVGAGAIGGYLAARLAAAGEEVTVIARGANLAAIRSQGLKLIEEDGREAQAGQLRAYEHCEEAGPHDYVLLALKAHQVEPIARSVPTLFGEHSALVTL